MKIVYLLRKIERKESLAVPFQRKGNVESQGEFSFTLSHVLPFTKRETAEGFRA